MILKILKKINNSFKKRGVLNTIGLAYNEIRFDYKYKLDTKKIIDLDSLNVIGKNKMFGQNYQGVNISNFKKVLSKLQIDFSESVFIDFGCGKGRALILANEFGFRKIIGIEFAEVLYDNCLQNIEIVKKKYTISEIEVQLLDAVSYVIPDNANVFCFFNPFNEIILSRVIDNIISSQNRRKRKMYIIYFSPFHEEIILKQGFMKEFELKSKNKIESAIYTIDGKNISINNFIPNKRK